MDEDHRLPPLFCEDRVAELEQDQRAAFERQVAALVGGLCIALLLAFIGILWIARSAGVI